MTTNLVHNAIAHNLPEHGTIRVTTRGRRRRGALTVENTGAELAPSLVATLTEPFRRGTDRIHADHVGAGLGLTIVRSIVQAHDGELVLALGRRWPAGDREPPEG